jgi:hypothetical protein
MDIELSLMRLVFFQRGDMNFTRRSTILFGVLIVLLLLPAACAPATPAVVKTAPTLTIEVAQPTATRLPATELPAVQKETYSNPFEYCGAVIDQDTPDALYVGPKMPGEITDTLKKAYQSSTDTPDAVYEAGSSWRCMGGKVYACFVGANLPCSSKANSDKTPTSGEKEFCESHPNSDFIPAAVTGRETIYEWRCNKNKPEISAQLFRVDERGYITEIWYPVLPAVEVSPTP